MNGSKNSKLIIVAVFVAAAVGVLIFAVTRGGGGGGGGSDKKTPAGGSQEPPGPGPNSGKVVVDFFYSSEKKAWVEDMVNQFEAANPGIDVKTTAGGSLSMCRDILDGKIKPTLWSPADTVAVNLLADDWFSKEHRRLFPESGPGAPQPLVLTPLVLVAWEERGNVLTKNGTEPLTWTRLHQVLSSPKGWLAVGGEADWGLIRLGHTDPTQSNSGLQALILMTYEFLGKRDHLAVGDVLDPKLQEFIAVIERGVPKFGSSTGTFMDEMVLYGPSKYDVVVSYESIAIQQLSNAQGRWGNLHVYYPKNTMWSSHPAALIEASWVTGPQREAGLMLLEFLRSHPAQTAALRYGFRPGDPTVPILGNDPNNPFRGAAAFGVQVKIPSVVEAPPGPVIHNLVEMWSRQFGRR